MSTAAKEYTGPLIRTVQVTSSAIIAHLADGRTVSVPLWWSWRLEEATPAQRKRFEILGGGVGVHWPDVDEDLSAWGFLHGTPAPRPKSQGKRRKPAPR